MSEHRVATPSKKVLPLPTTNKEKLFLESGEKKKQEDYELQKLIKKSVKEWCENTTSHGFSNIARTDSWIIRIVWLILVLCFMGYCIFTVVSIILTFLKYEVVVSYKIVSDSPSPFPAITICNLNPFDFGTDESTGVYLQNIMMENSFSPRVSISENETAILKIDEIRSIIKAHTTSDKNLSTDDLKAKGFTIDTMMISCFYNNQECSTQDFHWFRDNDFGNCYTFNDIFDGNNQKRDNLKTSKSGPENGLRMEIFVGVSGIQDFYSIKEGIKVVIHQRGVRPILKYDGIEVSTGAATYVAISRTNYSKEPPPYSNCRSNPNTLLASDSDYHKYTLSISRYYQKLCYEICLQYEQIVPNCDCADPSIPVVDRNLTICNKREKLACVKNQRDNFDSNKNIDQVCGGFCPNDCNQVIYSTTISQSIYPTQYYADILACQGDLMDKFHPPVSFSPQESQTTTLPPVSTTKNNSLSKGFTTLSSTSNSINREPPNQSQLSSSALMLSIFHENLQYNFIKETPAMTFDTMLGLIGGQLGLFMGASFLTLIEILEMFINLIRTYGKYKNEKKKIKAKFESK